MEFITGAVLSGIVYDMLKHQVTLTAANLKDKLSRWLVDDAVASEIEKELVNLRLTPEMSESVIEKELNSSSGLLTLLNKIEPNGQRHVYQSHTGSGDNVAGDKIIHSK